MKRMIEISVTMTPSPTTTLLMQIKVGILINVDNHANASRNNIDNIKNNNSCKNTDNNNKQYW